jgi:hypothetical protein
VLWLLGVEGKKEGDGGEDSGVFACFYTLGVMVRKWSGVEWKILCACSILI